jgi:hypothetical protein
MTTESSGVPVVYKFKRGLTLAAFPQKVGECPAARLS